MKNPAKAFCLLFLATYAVLASGCSLFHHKQQPPKFPRKMNEESGPVEPDPQPMEMHPVEPDPAPIQPQ